MTPEQILKLAHSAGVYVSVIDKPRPYLDKHGLLNLAKLIEAAAREECAKVVERDLYHEDSQKPYTQHYNSCIKALAEKIRSGT